MMSEDKNYSMNDLVLAMQNMNTMNILNNTKINEKLDSIQASLEPMKAELAKHSTAISHLDFEKRRKKIIIFGLVEKQGETFQDLENMLLRFITNTLELTDFTLLELDCAKRLKPQPGGKPRPILLGFTTQRRKIAVLKNRGKLKGTKIHIHEDAPPEVREKEKALQDEVRHLRNQGKFAVLRAGKIITHDNKVDPKKQANQTQEKTRTKRAHSESPNDTITSKRQASDQNVNVSNSMFYETDSAEFENFNNTLTNTNTVLPVDSSTPLKSKNM
uniref:Uncharacterized protein n=1 Tax=Cacopsylla melanoneura TaxID=428564 RepID=A0A8D8ZP84_9HEMI